MSKFRLSGGLRSHQRIRPFAAALGAAVCFVTVVSVLSGPAGALGAARSTGFAPHASSVAPSPALRPHTAAPLTLANIVVTDLSTGNSTFTSFTDVAPTNAPLENCNDGQTLLCMGWGPQGGANPSYVKIQASSLQPGQIYSDDVTIHAGVDGCGSLNNPNVVAAAELDQFTYASGVETAAIQFECIAGGIDISGTLAYNIVPTDPEDGYYVFGQQGEITGFGNDNYLAYLNGAQYFDLNSPIVGMAPTADGGGYWMIGSDGGVFSSGDAGFYGSTGGLHLNKPVVGMAPTPDGKGYWFVASDGGIFAYGDASFYGSRGGQPLNKPIVGMTATPDGKGYWLVASDGGIFSYGDAGFFGSTGSIKLNKPVVGMTPTPDGRGYWFVATDGGIFAYGDAGFYGSTGSIKLAAPIVGMTPTPDGKGYWFVANDGGIFSYGNAGFAGSLGGTGADDVAGMSLGILNSPPV
jgi:hypothetical protein